VPYPCPARDSLYFVVRTLHSRWIPFSPSPCSSKDVRPVSTSPEARKLSLLRNTYKAVPPARPALAAPHPRRPHPPASGCRVDARIGDASRPKGPWVGVVKACESRRSQHPPAPPLAQKPYKPQSSPRLCRPHSSSPRPRQLYTHCCAPYCSAYCHTWRQPHIGSLPLGGEG
jgi:hypothetical protein